MAELKIKADSGGGTVGLKGPASTTGDADFQLTLPVNDGDADQVLTTNGSGALSWAAPVVADNAITLAKMAGGTDGQIITYDANGDPLAVGPGTDGQVLTSTGANSPPAFETLPGGGISHIYTYNNAGFTLSGNQYMTANWADSNATETTDYSSLGSGMSESSGVFTFPATGHWLIQWRVFGYVQNTYSRSSQLRIYTTANNSSWSQRTTTANNQWDADGIGNGVVYDSLKTELIFDVTDVSNDKVKFYIENQSSTVYSGGKGSMVHFIKLADT